MPRRIRCKSCEAMDEDETLSIDRRQVLAHLGSSE